MKSKEARVLVAVDHYGIREFLVKFLSKAFEVVGTASDGFELTEAATHLRPDVVVGDFGLSGLPATAVMTGLRGIGFNVPFVFLSADRDLLPYVARDFGTCICKTEVVSELIPAIRLALEEKAPVSTLNRTR